MYELLRTEEAAQRTTQAFAASMSPMLATMSAHSLSRMMDILDYGIVAICASEQVLHANATAKRALLGEHALFISGGRIGARRAQDARVLRRAVSDAVTRGVQSMIRLTGPTGTPVSVAVLPLAASDASTTVVLVLGRQAVCADLSADAYARLHELTAAETRVLKLLCQDVRPDDIARIVGVKVSTVRTQIASIRAKTDARDIGGVVHSVARLPPLPCWARTAA